MSIMREKYLSGKFGTCPRVLCEKQNVIPIGISEDSKIARVKVYCPRCKDIYAPKKKFADVDGCYFGTSFPHLLLMVYFASRRPSLTSDQFSPERSSRRPSSGSRSRRRKLSPSANNFCKSHKSQRSPRIPWWQERRRRKRKNVDHFVMNGIR